MDELRDYGVGAQILTELGVQDMILLTNTHHTLVGLDGYGLSIVGERPIDLESIDGAGADRRSALLRPSQRHAARRRARRDRGGRARHEIVTVPGALEVPGAVALAAESGALRRLSSRWAW